MCACRFEHEAVASLLLERSIALDPELGKHVDGSLGRPAFIKYFIDNRAATSRTRSGRTVEGVCHGAGQRAVHDGDLTAFVGGLQREPWLLGEACV